MELYTLDSDLRRENVVEKFESLIWTERFSGVGEFELVIPQSFPSRRLFQPNTWLALQDTFRCMKVETSENYTDDDGRDLTKISGPSIEKILDDRVAFNVKDDMTTNPKWVISGQTPMGTARTIFNYICRDGIVDPDDIIPFLDLANDLFPEDTIPEPTDIITVEIEPQSVLAALKNLGDLYDFGMRLVRNYETSIIAFQLYTGSDRTSGQTTLPPVIFSPNLENLSSPRELASINGSKNVAYVYSPVGFEEVFPDDVDPAITGFQRQVLVVRADDITDTNPAIASALMIQRGKEELSKHRDVGMFDGVISQNSQYKYGVDYFLGDVVETQNKAGFANYMRVAEQIFVSDREGDRSYPTLETKKFVTPGSWSSWPLVSWIDYEGDPFEWADAP